MAGRVRLVDGASRAEFLPGEGSHRVFKHPTRRGGVVVAGHPSKDMKAETLPICASWNHLAGWLRAVDGLRRAA